jgi:LmbE family N-acetylglucosaminyl deacetylase
MSSRVLKLMAVLAHPDDESLGTGGVLAKYGAEGVQVSLVTATRGESGRFLGEKGGAAHPGPEKLGIIREAELRAAAATLGIRDLTLLGYIDGSLDQADPREAVGRIVTQMRRVKPDVVITFGPEGAYGHPDHIAICQFTTAAAIAAADPAYQPPENGAPSAPHAVAKLYYMVESHDAWEAYQAAFKRLVSVVDGVERVAQPWPEWQITTRIDTRAHWETVWKAVSFHYSQIAGYQRLRELSPQHHEALWGARHFYRVFSTVNGGRQRESDLFEGLR